jgi:hypothetical protein
MSDPFLRRLIGPACRAEMTRRMGARSALEAAETARRVAFAETGRSFDLQGLVEAGYLSERIRRRSDGSELRLAPGGFTDSLRGRRGTFLPIPDVGVERLTVAEARAYDSFSTFYRRQWERVDPAVIRIVLVPGTKAPAAPPAGAPPAVPTAGAASGDRVDLVVDILPFAREPYQLLRAALAPSAGQSLEPLPDEIFSVEGRLGLMLSPKPFLMRVGLLDFDRSIFLDQAESRFLSDLWILPAYAILPVTERFPDGTLSTLLMGGKPGPDGFIRLEGGLIDAPMWGKECAQGLVVSPRKEIAERVAGAIRTQEQGPAQVRLRIDLGDSRRITPSIRANAYQRTLQASEASASLLSVLHGVLKVPLAECETEAQRILAARVVCPAGGKFIANPYPSAGGPFFTSDAFPPEGRSESEKIRRAMAYRSSALEWLRALKISFRLDGRALHSEATIILPPESKE